MNKASKALRRSSVRLKSLSCGHSELNLIVSDLKEFRSAAKHFTDAQETVWKDLFKWASRERNEAIRESFSYLFELNQLWTEIQCDFVEQLNKFKHSFEMILEGEVGVDKLRDHLGACETRENKLKKNLVKATKKDNANEVRQIEEKIVDNRSSIKATQLEITERTHENEAVKLIRLKESLLKLTAAYMEQAHKSIMIFDGQKNVVTDIPEMDSSRNMHSVRYRGGEAAKVTVARVKESVNLYKQSSQHHPQAPPTCPPPYTSPPPLYPSTTSPPSYPTAAFPYPPSYQNTVGFMPHHNGWTSRYASSSGSGPARYDLPPSEDYEQDLSGAVGGARI
ncbi:uncharacterized protein LOC128982210 [Macrosteles quadrilineatus]|uniref:uncharacterized protein LOC128982210 n=1 Tax=Macrosteles quadrilineatus TaxID=74068 RepID=UPI0023E23761|nr:uncharacterized protein LOC128982210 [Macrosteles quadrilineatus]